MDGVYCTPCPTWEGGSGGDHALVPLAVSHVAAVVVGPPSLAGLLLAAVLQRLLGLALALGLANHAARRLGAKAGTHGRDRQGRG